jgi:spore coat polysaccharide biosynthesis protein SpsF (cytidylyltransferase family)
MRVAIIQARMGSSRCEGKVMKEALGKPLIGYLLERVAASPKLDKVVLATSVDPRNRPMSAYARSIGFEVYEGDENDVLDRYYQAALRAKADEVVRITGDCPLIDMGICDRLFDMFSEAKADYAHLSPRFAEGLDCEIFRFASLERAWKEADKKSEREHVTLYFNNHPEAFGKKVMDNTADDSMYRITVDEPEDLDVVRTVIEALYGNGSKASWPEVKRFLDAHPEVTAKNSHIIRNEGLIISLKNDCSVRKSADGAG